jgi:hypothetical protein
MVSGVPDVHTTAANPSLRYVDLNRRINADYGRFGELFQSIIDPSFTHAGSSDAHASWFAFAAFASRGIGQAELGAQIALDAARAYRESGDPRAALARAVSPHAAELAAGLIEALVREQDRLAATFLAGFASACRHRGAFEGFAFSAILDPRVLAVGVERLLELMAEAPGSDPIERLASVALTLRNTMAEGNRRIYSDIGGAAQDYLSFRQSQSGGVTFSLSNRPDLAKAAYDFAIGHLEDDPLPNRFDQLFPDLMGDTRPLVVAAFALYEQAGETPDTAAKNRCVAFANNFALYREQHEAIQPAFTPGRVLSGEVDRLKLLAIITPGIEVALRLETWRFWEFAERHLPARNLHLLQARATEYNWGLFEDRWAPVVDTFGPCYRNPRAMWPAPNPDPNESF